MRANYAGRDHVEFVILPCSAHAHEDREIGVRELVRHDDFGVTEAKLERVHLRPASLNPYFD